MEELHRKGGSGSYLEIHKSVYKVYRGKGANGDIRLSQCASKCNWVANKSHLDNNQVAHVPFITLSPTNKKW